MSKSSKNYKIEYFFSDYILLFVLLIPFFIYSIINNFNECMMFFANYGKGFVLGFISSFVH